MPDNVRCNTNTINYDAMLSKKEVSEAFEDMLPVFVASQIIVTNVKVEKSNGTKNRIDG